MVHPLVFEPIYKRRVWGGQGLRRLGKPIPENQPIGESWELADLPGDKSVVARGPLTGTPIDELIRLWGPELLGRASLVDGSFPLLIKFLDAGADLSVQVHPDAAMVQRSGGDLRIKHEAWYVLHAERDGAIYKGVRPGVTREEFTGAVADGTCVQLLNRVAVRAGDCHYLPSGTLHALGSGVMVAEIQTPSDVTYRVYDWDRVDPATGRHRELHIAEAMECIHFGPHDESAERRSHVGSYWTTVTRLVTCPSFIVEKVRMVAGVEQPVPYAEPVVWIILQGRGEIRYAGGRHGLGFQTGDTVLLPAALPDGRVCLDDDGVWLEVTIPAPSDLAEYGRPGPERLRAPDGSPSAPIQINLPPKRS